MRSGESIGARGFDPFHWLKLDSSTAETGELVTSEAFHNIQPDNDKIRTTLVRVLEFDKDRRCEGWAKSGISANSSNARMLPITVEINRAKWR